MSKVGAKKIVTMLEEIVSQYGEDHTEDCVYRSEEEDAPRCIAGQVIFRLGGLEALDRLVEDRIIGVCEKVGDRGEAKDPNENEPIALEFMTKRALHTLRVAQFSQDASLTWGTALEEAKRFEKKGSLDL